MKSSLKKLVLAGVFVFINIIGFINQDCMVNKTKMKDLLSMQGVSPEKKTTHNQTFQHFLSVIFNKK